MDPLHHVFSQDNAESMHSTTQALRLCTSSTAAPIMALCSGHLLDDHLDDHGGTQDGICGKCGRPAVEDHAAELGSRVWQQTWHTLTSCASTIARQQSLAVFEAGLLGEVESSPEYKTQTQVQGLHGSTTRAQMTRKYKHIFLAC